MLFKLTPAMEEYIDGFLENQGESMLKGFFVLIGSKVLALPVAATLVSLFHVTADSVSAWAQMGAAAIALGGVHWIHEHFFNGNAAPAPTAQTVAQQPQQIQPAASAQATAPAPAAASSTPSQAQQAQP